MTSTTPATQSVRSWNLLIAKYQHAHRWKSLWQICTSVLPLILLWALMAKSLSVGYWLTLLLAVPAAGMVIRTFIIQHDCGHGSFFSSRRANDLAGMACSVFTFIPYHYWRKGHAIHHANAGKLEHRGIGDIHTMTVAEYRNASRAERLKYRIYRNPLVLFVIAPAILFVVAYRFPYSSVPSLRNMRKSVYMTNLVMAATVGGLMFLVGVKAFLLIQLPITIISSSAGVWLFYIQHQFEDAYWSTDDRWEYVDAALQGSSYYKLPRVLHWFTGNIGFHHVHHLSPKIPNYLLRQCHEETPQFRGLATLTLRASLRSLRLRLWDEDRRMLVGFADLKSPPVAHRA